MHWTKRSVRTGGISCGISGSTPDSPLFGKNKMATFERYFLAEKETHVEKKNPYYALLENEKVIDKILIEIWSGSIGCTYCKRTGGRPGETACGISQW